MARAALQRLKCACARSRQSTLRGDSVRTGTKMSLQSKLLLAQQAAAALFFESLHGSLRKITPASRKGLTAFADGLPICSKSLPQSLSRTLWSPEGRLLDV